MTLTRTSTYLDAEGAQLFTQRTIDANRVRISEWLSHDSSPRIAVTAFFHGETTGRMLPLGMLYAGRGPIEVSGTCVVLARAPERPNGFSIHSTYPIES